MLCDCAALNLSFCLLAIRRRHYVGTIFSRCTGTWKSRRYGARGRKGFSLLMRCELTEKFYRIPNGSTVRNSMSWYTARRAFKRRTSLEAFKRRMNTGSPQREPCGWEHGPEKKSGDRASADAWCFIGFASRRIEPQRV